MLNTRIIEPKQPANACVIWLHGLGDSGDGFAPVVPELNLPDKHRIRFVFPHAPIRPVTLNQGMEMRAWYDIKTMDSKDRADEAGVLESVGQVHQLIHAQQQQGIASDRILLAGFSQGGVVALHLACRAPFALAGIMALSTYLCRPDKLIKEKTTANQNTPLLMHHGDFDDVVPLSLALDAKETLTGCGFQPEWRTWPMAHSLCEPQLSVIRDFIVRCLL